MGMLRSDIQSALLQGFMKTWGWGQRWKKKPQRFPEDGAPPAQGTTGHPGATRLHLSAGPSAPPTTTPTDTSSKLRCPAQPYSTHPLTHTPLPVRVPHPQVPPNNTHSTGNSRAKCHPSQDNPCARWRPPPRRGPAAPSRRVTHHQGVRVTQGGGSGSCKGGVCCGSPGTRWARTS